MVKGRDPRLAETLDGGQRACVNNAHAQIGVGSL